MNFLVSPVPIGGIDFLHCWVADSIWLERAEPLTTKR